MWFTETAGLVARHKRSPIHFRLSPGHAARVTQFIFSKLAHLSRRIARVYLYQWDTLEPTDTWDSARIDLNGHGRPAHASCNAGAARTLHPTASPED